MVQPAVPRIGTGGLADEYPEISRRAYTQSRHDDAGVPHQTDCQGYHAEEDSQSLGDATPNDGVMRIWFRADQGARMGHHVAQVRSEIFVQLRGLGGGWKDHRVLWIGASCLANLAQDKEHVLLAGQRTQQHAFGQGLELPRGYLEALDQVSVLSNFFEDRAFVCWWEIQPIFGITFHGGRF